MTRLATLAGLLAVLTACIENRVYHYDPPPPALPPDGDDDVQGDPPNWQECASGFLGQYYNLRWTNPAVGDLAVDAPLDVAHPSDLGWWAPDDHSYTRYDPSIDFGANWWPVDEGLRSDPDYFAVSWRAWMRVWDDTTVRLILGGADDAWVLFDDEIVAYNTSDEELVVETFDVNQDPGQVPVEIWFAHRRSPAAGFRFRIVGGDVSLCYPEYEDDASE